jgi:hypothetical protein
MRLSSLESPLQGRLNFSDTPTVASEVFELLNQIPVYIPSMDLLWQMVEVLLEDGQLSKDDIFPVEEVQRESSQDWISIEIPHNFIRNWVAQVIHFSLDRAQKAADYLDNTIQIDILWSSQMSRLGKIYPEMDLWDYRIYIGNIEFYELVAKKLWVRLVTCDSSEPDAEFFRMINAAIPGVGHYSYKLSQLGIPLPWIISENVLKYIWSGLRILFPWNKYISVWVSSGYFPWNEGEFGIALFTK